jgi:energy-coupling factor transport system substrate-specific component
MYVSQVVMSALPNIEIVSLLIIVVTHKFGVKALASVYVFVMCEIMTYGLSLWVINYLYVWAVLCIIICLLRKIGNTWVYTLAATVFGLMFGTLCSIPYFFMGGISMVISYIIGGISFDLLHCGGNFITTLLLSKPLIKAMDKAIKPHK